MLGIVNTEVMFLIKLLYSVSIRLQEVEGFPAKRYRTNRV